MRNVLPAVGMMGAWLLLGCAGSGVPGGAAALQGGDACVLSEAIMAPAPQGVGGESVAPDTQLFPWYFSSDRSIRMLQLPLWAGERNKVAWFRPDGADLQVSGRRVDGAALPMIVDIGPQSYPHMFCPSLLVFPTEGCWEIVGKSGQSELRAVVKIARRP